MDLFNLPPEFRTGFVENDGTFVTPVARLSYPALLNRVEQEDPVTHEKKDPVFKSAFIFNTWRANEPALVDLNTVFIPEIQRTAQTFFSSRGEQLPFGLPVNLRDGREKQGKEGYGEGVMFISATNFAPPSELSRIAVVDGLGNMIGAGQFKAGDYVRARIDLYVSKKWPKKGVNFALKSVQVLAPGEPFGAAQDTGREWASVPGAVAAPPPINAGVPENPVVGQQPGYQQPGYQQPGYQQPGGNNGTGRGW